MPAMTFPWRPGFQHAQQGRERRAIYAGVHDQARMSPLRAGAACVVASPRETTLSRTTFIAWNPLYFIARRHGQAHDPAEVASVICTVYWGGEGFVLVPDCLVASRDAERRFGPLTYCGSLETQGLPEDLNEQIGREIDERSFVRLAPDLALRLGYQPAKDLPLPSGFRWRELDWWTSEELTLVCGRYPPVAVASVQSLGTHGGWKAVTNCHRPPSFRGARISHTRAAAAQYVAIWAATHAHTLRAEILDVRH